MFGASKIYFPLTISQKILLAPQIVTYDPIGSREYDVITIRMDFINDYDFDALQKACDELIKNNESLRLRFILTLSGIKQRIEIYKSVPIEHLTFENEVEFTEFFNRREKYLKVPLFSSNPIRFILADYNSGSSLIIRVNHFLADGYSAGLMIKQLQDFYSSFLSNDLPEHKDASYSFEQFLSDEKTYRKSELRKKSKRFWKKKYKEQPNFTDPFRGRKYKSDVSIETLEINKELYNEIKKFCHENGIPIMFLLQIAAASTINRITGMTNFMYWILNHGRTTFAQKNTVGCMMNAVPLIFNFSKDETIESFIKRSFMEYLENTRFGKLSLLDHLKCGWKKFICKGGPNVYCFYWSTLNLSNFNNDLMQCSVLPHHYLTHQMYCCGYEANNEQICVNLIYQSQLYSKDEIELIKKSFVNVLEELCRNSDKPVEYIYSSWNGPKISRFN